MIRPAVYWRIASFFVAAGFVGLWQLIANLKLVSPVFLPGPDRAWASLVRGFTSGDLASKVLGTLEHMVYGWFLASVAGIALGALIGSSRAARSRPCSINTNADVPAHQPSPPVSSTEAKMSLARTSVASANA